MQQFNAKKIIIAGGGTGGHIFPAVAIANALKKLNADNEILFVGAIGKMEMEKVPKEGYKIIGLPIDGFNRASLLKNISLPFKLVKSLLKAKQILKSFKPDAVVGVGGYASFPILFMAQRLGIPTLIQEQNGFAGKSNIRLGKKAKAVCVAYDGMEKFFPQEVIQTTGNPVRSVLSKSTVTRQEALSFFGLDANKKTILIIGGSLGAKSINDTIVAQYEQLMKHNVQLLWQTGKRTYQNVYDAMHHVANVHVHEFIYDMDKAYAAADLVISRAGALSIAELCIVAKPVVFVPYPFAAEDHQTTNAMNLVNKNAAAIVKDSEVQTALVSTVESLLLDETKQNTFAQNIKKLGIDNADERIAKQVYIISKP